MSLPKKGSRLLTTGGNEYRYLVKQQQMDNVVTIQIATGQGAVFQYKTPIGPAIQPVDVKTAIENALAQGWDPNAAGAAFTLKV